MYSNLKSKYKKHTNNYKSTLARVLKGRWEIWYFWRIGLNYKHRAKATQPTEGIADV